LVVDDNKEFLDALRRAVSKEHKLLMASSLPEARSLLECPFDVALIDLRLDDEDMDNRDGLILLREINQKSAEIPCVVFSAVGDIPTAVRAIKEGAVDFLEKGPGLIKNLNSIINGLVRESKLRRKAKALDRIIRHVPRSDMVGDSPQIKEALRLAKFASENDDIPVLIRGPSGSGKKHFAQWIHQNGKSELSPFYCINIPHYSESALREIFLGSSGKTFSRYSSGLNGGILCLNEIQFLPTDLQEFLAQAFGDTKVESGNKQDIRKSFRLICLTSENLEKLLSDNSFSHNLFRVIQKLHLVLPPLKERKNDIPILAKHFFEQIQKKEAFQEERIAPNVFPLLKGYSWPGNAAELGLCIESSYLMASILGDYEIRIEHLPYTLRRVMEPMSKKLFPYSNGKIDVFQGLAEYEISMVEAYYKSGEKRLKLWEKLGYSNRHQIRRRIKRHFQKYPQLRERHPSLFKEFLMSKGGNL